MPFLMYQSLIKTRNVLIWGLNKSISYDDLGIEDDQIYFGWIKFGYLFCTSSGWYLSDYPEFRDFLKSGELKSLERVSFVSFPWHMWSKK